MNKLTTNHLKVVFSLAVMLFVFTNAIVLGQSKNSRRLSDAKKQSDKASVVFRQVMGVPEKAIPKTVLNGAECVAVFPQVLKAGFIIGGRGGRGVVSCRTPQGWSAPAYLNLAGGSFGLQIGAQSTDFVMLFMTADGIHSLLSNKFTIGGDASVAAGPVGRQAGASTDLKLNAQILSYSRSRGLFAGLELKGVVISPDKDDNKKVYGDEMSTQDVLQLSRLKAPAQVRAFSNLLGRYSPRRSK